MAYVGHYLGIKDDLSVLENLRFIRDFLGTSTRSCQELIQQVGLARVSEQHARTLSAGQRKRCALARLKPGSPPRPSTPPCRSAVARLKTAASIRSAR